MPNRFVSDDSETKDIVAQIKEQTSQKKKLAAMNLGSLVRGKMKELSADFTGEYVDNSGKHFTMKTSGDGYTIGYAGGTKEIEVTKPQALKLAGNCRKLDGDEKKAVEPEETENAAEGVEGEDEKGKKKLASDKPFAAQHWIARVGELKNFAMNEKDPRRIEDFISRIQGIWASISIGDWAGKPETKPVAEAVKKAVDEIKSGKNYSKP